MSDEASADIGAKAGSDPLKGLLGYWLRRASAVMMADLGTSLATVELRPTEATILILIRDQPGLTQSEIGRALGIARANMAPLMAALIRKGLVRKSKVDGRSQALALTSAGEARTAEAQAIVDDHEHRFQSRLSPDLLEHIIHALKKLGSA